MIVRLIKKIFISIYDDGLLRTMNLVICYPVNYYKFKSLKAHMLKFDNPKDRWTWAWKSNSWRQDESASGDGSSLKYTLNLRKKLPHLLESFQIKTIFDAPCGDLNWMSDVLSTQAVNYQGGDIVKPLVEELNLKFGNENTSFIYFNLIEMVPPKSDLMICRDCLIHFSYGEAHAVLRNFLLSGTKYLLTTTHANPNGKFKNTDILNGEFRLIDLFSAPYHFPKNPLFVIEDWIPPFPERQMCLWSREQIQTALDETIEKM